MHLWVICHNCCVSAQLRCFNGFNQITMQIVYFFLGFFFPTFPFPFYLSLPLSLNAALKVIGLLGTELLDSLVLCLFFCQAMGPLLLPLYKILLVVSSNTQKVKLILLINA